MNTPYNLLNDRDLEALHDRLQDVERAEMDRYALLLGKVKREMERRKMWNSDDLRERESVGNYRGLA